MRYRQNLIRVCLFCGGRGAASLIRELLRRPQIELNLLINAYDDGLSTGALRDFIPGMLGPSDFRKNLSYLLDLSSAQQYALQQLFEYRLPAEFGGDDLARLRRAVGRRAHGELAEPLAGLIGALDPDVRRQCFAFLARFIAYYDERIATQPLAFPDCSFGNLIFAGAYLANDQDFNAAASALAGMVGSRGKLINVSDGACRVLVGLKADGTLLTREAEIVGPQSPSPVLDTFFLEDPPENAAWEALKQKTVDAKLAWLTAHQTMAGVSPAAASALAGADIIIFGPGTQHSSLLPSYRIAQAAVLASRASVKAFVANLQEDVDIQGLAVTDLVDNALKYLGDSSNVRRGITHVFYNSGKGDDQNRVRLEPAEIAADGTYRGARLIEGAFENPVKPEVHNGYSTVNAILAAFDCEAEAQVRGEIDIFVDLLGRSLALDLLVQEIEEIPWTRRFSRVRISLNKVAPPRLTGTPAGLCLEQVNVDEAFSEIAVLKRWLTEGTSEYLVTMTGDGEYRFRDILLAAQIFEAGGFGVIMGSRTQSRRQLQSSLRAAYGEGGLMYHLSRLGGLVVSGLFALRFGVVFSDPLTGFRLYRRGHLSTEFAEALHRGAPTTATEVTKLLIDSRVEIAEIPVSYGTFRGFTQRNWRFRRGLRNLVGVFL